MNWSKSTDKVATLAEEILHAWFKREGEAAASKRSDVTRALIAIKRNDLVASLNTACDSPGDLSEKKRDAKKERAPSEFH